MLSLLLLFGPGCGAVPGYRFPGADVTVTPADTIDFGVVRLGANASIDVQLTNSGTVAATVELAVDPPFTLSASTLTVVPDEPLTLAVRYAPVDYAAAAGVLHVTWDDGAAGLDVPVAAQTDPDSDADGYEAAAVGGSDCDDRDAAVYPGAPDTCYDRIDQDCDASGGVDPDDVDCDGDGVWIDEGDCDDLDAGTNPGEVEVSGDGIDQDCDGLRDEDDRAYGDLVISEVHDGGANPGWVELCNVTAAEVPIDGFVLRWTTGSVVLAPWTLGVGACVAVCERESNDCELVGEITVDASRESLEISAAETSLDVLVVPGSWGWDTGDVWSLDPDRLDADLNDVASAWCDTHGSQGAMNPPCP